TAFLPEIVPFRFPVATRSRRISPRFRPPVSTGPLLLSNPLLPDLRPSRNHPWLHLRLILAPRRRIRTRRRLGKISLLRRRGVFLPGIDERREVGVELVGVLAIHEVPALGDDDHLRLRVFCRDRLKESHLSAQLGGLVAYAPIEHVV